KQTGFRVIKYEALSAGKGVMVADTEEETIKAARDTLSRGPDILIEDRLEGYELSVIVLCDGVNVVLLPIAQDYKRLLDGDKGPNTGGMGAYAPVPVDESLLAKIRDTIILPTLRGMAAQGTPYHGALYAGIMVTEDGPKLIEYNARFGDPECQVILPLIESDIVPYLYACSEKGGLAKMPPLRVRQACAVCTVLVPQGYPGVHKTGFPIYTYDLKAIDPRVTVFHGGTEEEYSGRVVMVGDRTLPVVGLRATGGRTLSVVGIGDTFESAAQSSRRVAGVIASRSHGKLFFRKDIAKNVAK
ncbi:phosphoribosylamine--glycine ligase, partial [Candidatus Kaiserbacteria bacterium]|nr:phosphoribosylamine--glycine ligase [Candidatus Kaiserbacteria bacterium]